MSIRSEYNYEVIGWTKLSTDSNSSVATSKYTLNLKTWNYSQKGNISEWNGMLIFKMSTKHFYKIWNTQSW